MTADIERLLSGYLFIIVHVACMQTHARRCRPVFPDVHVCYYLMPLGSRILLCSVLCAVDGSAERRLVVCGSCVSYISQRSNHVGLWPPCRESDSGLRPSS